MKEKRIFDAKKPFLEKVNLSDLEKTETDQLQLIKSQPSVVEVIPVKYASDALFMIRSLEIPLANQKPLKINRYDFKNAPQLISVSATEVGLSLNISISGNNLHGVFYANGKTYAVEPLGRGYQVIILLK